MTVQSGRMRKPTIVLTAGIVVTLAGLAAWAWFDDASAVQYRTAAVEHGDINVTISATGNPNAVVTVQVGSQVSGNILALFADFNTKVTKGELIARIDPAPFQTKVNQAQANVDAARAAVANSQAVVQQALAGIQAAKSSLAAAQANVVKAEAIAEDAKVKVDRRVVMVEAGRRRQGGSRNRADDVQVGGGGSRRARGAAACRGRQREGGAGAVECRAIAGGRQPGAGEAVRRRRCSRPRSTWITRTSRRRWMASWCRETWTSDRPLPPAWRRRRCS